MSDLDVWYSRASTSTTRSPATRADRLAQERSSAPRSELAKARTKDSLQALAKLTDEVDGEPRISADPPLIVPIDELWPGDQAATLLGLDPRAPVASTGAPCRPTAGALLERYRFVDLARKVVGVGSVGTRAWIVLLLGRDGGDPLFLQVKEAEASVLEAFAGRSVYRNAGQRVVEGQRLMQAASDIFLGWVRVTDSPDGGARLLRAPAARLEGLGRHRGDGAQGHAHLRRDVRLDPGPGPRPLGRPGRHRRLPRARATSSTGRWPSSPWPTPTRTSATTSRSRRPWPAGGSRRRPGSSRVFPALAERQARRPRPALPWRLSPVRGDARGTRKLLTERG